MRHPEYKYQTMKCFDKRCESDRIYDKRLSIIMSIEQVAGRSLSHIRGKRHSHLPREMSEKNVSCGEQCEVRLKITIWRETSARTKITKKRINNDEDDDNNNSQNAIKSTSVFWLFSSPSTHPSMLCMLIGDCQCV